MDNLPPYEQDPAEFAALLGLLEREQVTSILEVGVFQGGTLARFQARFPRAVVVGIDPRPMIKPAPPITTLHFIPLVLGASQDPQVRQRARSYNGGENFDFVFIDGDHTAPAARTDWEWARDEARKLVAFHDVDSMDNPSIEVNALWREIIGEFSPHGVVSKHYRTETISNGQPGNGIGVVWIR